MMADPKPARISAKDIEAIRDLERKIGNDVCLVAVEKRGVLYALEAKTAPNVWARVDRVYPEIEGLTAYYARQEDAHLAKAGLKSLLNSSKAYKTIKKPVRIRKIAV
ncbi:hypothetical protein DENIS_4286 [Desulfonema ishimotonii]|uniref:Uncharacterized protein n=1 Tax=Desulfonema ishimotonii TaxID=45657 RepID=A0A401G236_9BACT|nr:hypothetical protein [Desulfonema ishimotonii]GBC63292.1 hypothetical protein DENIS_4286 [Desulfonema ishimotonii]